MSDRSNIINYFSYLKAFYYLIICNYKSHKLIIVDVFGGKINKNRKEKCINRLKMNAKGIKNKATSSGSGNASFSKKFK